MFYWFKGLLVPWVCQLLKFRTANQKKCLELPAAKSQFGQQFPSGTACGTCQHLRAAWTQKVHAGILKPSYFRVSHEQNPRDKYQMSKCRGIFLFSCSPSFFLYTPKKRDKKSYAPHCRHWTILKAKCPSVFRVQVTVPAELAPEDGHPQPGSDEPAMVLANRVRMGKVVNLDHHLYGWKGTPFQTTNQWWYIWYIIKKIYIYMHIIYSIVILYTTSNWSI